MDEIQDVEATPTPVRWLILIAAILTALWLIGKKAVQVYKCVNGVDEFLSDWRGDPEHGTPGVMERIERIENRIERIENRLESLEKSGGEH